MQQTLEKISTDALHKQQILVLDFGSQYTQNIARRIRESGGQGPLRAKEIIPSGNKRKHDSQPSLEQIGGDHSGETVRVLRDPPPPPRVERRRQRKEEGAVGTAKREGPRPPQRRRRRHEDELPHPARRRSAQSSFPEFASAGHRHRPRAPVC